ncbi:MAG: DNA-3-methyladenine glycosylase, partial [Patescibacteria group bacterium]
MRELPHSWFADDAVLIAPKLLGKIVRHGETLGRIVETEAYT